ncbi:unnamed protein product [Sphagnum jensenii]|uniref:DRBM domain-containing protein n=1 Tax=Sphagnum jensenii TaxID=128206 RepID=A0ABP0VBA0_9BRYO
MNTYGVAYRFQNNEVEGFKGTGFTADSAERDAISQVVKKLQSFQVPEQFDPKRVYSSPEKLTPQEYESQTISGKYNDMKPIKGQIIKAPNRAAILDYILDNNAALYVDQVDMLSCCGLCDEPPTTEELEELKRLQFLYPADIEIPSQLAQPLLVDKITACAMRLVRNGLTEETKVKFDNLPWHKAAKISWGCVK